MKICPTCRSKYPDDANFCPQETCAQGGAPQRLEVFEEPPPSRFEIGERLGGGGTGEVFRAKDRETGGEVAYKVVAAAALPTPAALDRAQRELKQLGRAQSDRVARIVTHGKTPEGQLTIAMELCEGEPLDRLLARQGPLPLERAKRLMAQIGEALLEGQKVGVVHHDVAPQNVLVDAADNVKLINFCLARPVTDKIFGIPEYLSPEQAEGKPVDQRSNTYSLGALFYALLTGEPPFFGDGARAVLDQHLKGEATPPSKRRPEAGLPAEADRVVAKALEKSSSRRHLTLRQFLSEVETVPVGGVAAAAGQKDVGFAKTMMFAGTAADLVPAAPPATVVATPGAPAPRTTAPMAPTPTPVMAAPPVMAALTPTPVMAMPTPTPVMNPVVIPPEATPPGRALPGMAPASASPRPLGAAVARTIVVAPPARSVAVPAQPADYDSAGPTPPPELFPPPAMPPRAAVDAPASAELGGGAASAMPSSFVSASPPKGGGSKKKGPAFRETLWFKKGDVEQLVSDAKAKMGQAGQGAPDAPGEDVRPIEDRYVDDGSLTAEDRKQFSLRSGGSQTNLPTVGGRARVPGERMNEHEMLREIGGSRKTAILVGTAVLAIVIVVVLVMTMSKKPAEPTPSPSPAAAVAPPPSPAAPSPSPTAPPSPPAAAKPPAPSPSAPAKSASNAKASAKKKPGRSKSTSKTSAKKKPGHRR